MNGFKRYLRGQTERTWQSIGYVCVVEMMNQRKD